MGKGVDSLLALKNMPTKWRTQNLHTEVVRLEVKTLYKKLIFTPVNDQEKPILWAKR